MNTNELITIPICDIYKGSYNSRKENIRKAIISTNSIEYVKEHMVAVYRGRISQNASSMPPYIYSHDEKICLTVGLKSGEKIYVDLSLEEFSEIIKH